MSIVIVGAGLAGGTAATELREQGYDGPVVLIGAEDHPPYERPPLSKGYLLGNDPLEDAFVHPREWYAEHDVDLRLGVHATALDTGAHTVQTSAGEVGYDRLLLATGAEPRRLELAEQSGAPTAYLRTIEDSDRLKAAFARGGRIVVVGAGWIGLEAAAAARSAGCDVTVIETAALPLLRVLGPTVAEVFADLHREQGVDLRLSATRDTGRPRRRRPRRGRGRGGAARGPGRGGGPGGRQRRPRGCRAAHVRARRVRRGRHRQPRPPGARPADPRGALGHGDQPGQGRGAQPRRCRRALRGDAVLLHRPVRPRHGVRRPRQRGRRGGRAREPQGAGVPGVLGPRGAGRRGDARERLGRHRRPARRRRLRRPPTRPPDPYPDSTNTAHWRDGSLDTPSDAGSR